MPLRIEIQNVYGRSGVPTPAKLRSWAKAALVTAGEKSAELCIRIVTKAESARLNQGFRHKKGATNVLSFPADIPEEIDLPLLGDLVICADVVIREAREQKKTNHAHWAHMVVHGTLHLLGKDHIKKAEAKEMEALEIKILQQLGFANPYN